MQSWRNALYLSLQQIELVLQLFATLNKEGPPNMIGKVAITFFRNHAISEPKSATSQLVPENKLNFSLVLPCWSRFKKKKTENNLVFAIARVMYSEANMAAFLVWFPSLQVNSRLLRIRRFFRYMIRCFCDIFRIEPFRNQICSHCTTKKNLLLRHSNGYEFIEMLERRLSSCLGTHPATSTWNSNFLWNAD